MNLLILGASLAQVPGIRMARSMGHDVITCDNRDDSPGHALANRRIWASTFEPAAIIAALDRQGLTIDGAMTMGTDQPVLTAALLARRLGLPSPLSVETARAVTDKRVMKKRLVAHHIPTVPHVFVQRRDTGSLDRTLSGLTAPYVVKPVDAQGQRGLVVLDRPDELADHIDAVLAHSRADEVLVESYYPSDEITVSGWVEAGQVKVLTMTDRLSFPGRQQLGICLSHEWPSCHLPALGAQLVHWTRRIVLAFAIDKGPVYIQYLVGRDGLVVNELACRIGGAFESQFIPELTGFDITRSVIRTALGQALDPRDQASWQQQDLAQNQRALSVQLFFAQPGPIHRLTPLAEVTACPGVLEAGYFKQEGERIEAITDATARVGYCIVLADSKAELEGRLAALYRVLRVDDDQGINRIIHRPLAPEHTP